MEKLINLVAKANKVREDGKVFTEKMLKMFAKESPEKYKYLPEQKELWIKTQIKNKQKNV